MTVNEFLPVYKEHQAETMKPATVESRVAIIRKYLLPSLGNRLISSISTCDIMSIYSQMDAAELSANSKIGIRCAIVSFFNLAIELGHIEKNPADRSAIISIQSAAS